MCVYVRTRIRARTRAPKDMKRERKIRKKKSSKKRKKYIIYINIYNNKKKELKHRNVAPFV